MATYYWKHPDPANELLHWQGLVVAKTIEDLFFEIDAHTDPSGVVIKPVRSASICWNGLAALADHTNLPSDEIVEKLPEPSFEGYAPISSKAKRWFRIESTEDGMALVPCAEDHFERHGDE